MKKIIFPDDDNLKELINSQEPDFLEPMKKVGSKQTYRCPECGEHELQRYKAGNKTMWKCFGCDYCDDVLGLYQNANHYIDFSDALNGAAEYYHFSGNLPTEYSPEKARPESAKAAPTEPEEEEDLTKYIEECAARLPECDYLTRRGISKELQQKFKIGYDPAYTDPRTGHYIDGGRRLIIPSDKYFVTARALDADAVNKKLKAGKASRHLFNGKALADPRPLFVVEGEIDALSLIEVGFNAVAIGGANNRKALITALKAPGRREPVIIALDNDSAGKDATRRIMDDISENKIRTPIYVIGENAVPGSPNAINYFYGSYKDANERLMNDRAGLKEAAAESVRMCGEDGEKERYNLQSVSGHLQQMLEGIQANKRQKPYSTGFRDLDNILNGGFRPKQVCYLGAISSLGKTTFLVQMADNMAAAGRDVLYFSLETPEEELIAKIISRYTYEQSIKAGRNAELAKTMYSILDGNKWDNSTPEEVEGMKQAFRRLEKHGKNLRFICSIGDANADDVRKAVEEHIRITGKHPAVFIDYLQIMRPLEKDRNGRDMKYSSDRAAMDATVSALKHLAVDLEVPVIAISALNRDNYLEPINTAAFKESGGIEYGSEILIGLQYEGMDYRDGEKQNDRIKRIHELREKATAAGRTGDPIAIELEVLKNRNGRKGRTYMHYMNWFNRFKEVSDNLLARKKEEYGVRL